MNYLKFKVCRQIGENIWQNKKLTPRQNTLIKLVIKKNINRKQSDFSKKLQQLKKLVYFYGMHSLNNRASSIVSYNYLDKKKSLLLTLETRLDVILVRIHFCSSLFTARQLITHKKICVNFNIVNIPAFSVKNGDIISIVANQLDLIKSHIKQNLSAMATPVGPNLIGSSRAPSWPSTMEATPRSRVMGAFRQKQKKPAWHRFWVSYHVEVCYKTFNAVVLYEPIQIHFPYKIDLDLLF